MSRGEFTSCDALLHNLLDRFEAKPSVSHHRAYVNYDGFKNIAEQDRVDPRTQCDRARWRYPRAAATGRYRNHFACAARRGRRSLSSFRPSAGLVGVTKAITLVRSRTGLPSTAAVVLDELAGAWARGVSRFNLRANDAEGLCEAVELVLALERRAADPTATLMDYRTFSRLAGVHSKALEQRVAAVVTLFDCFFPDRRQPTLDASEVLATFGIAPYTPALATERPTGTRRCANTGHKLFRSSARGGRSGEPRNPLSIC